MSLKPIRTKRDHLNALGRIEKLWAAKPGSKAGDELEILTALVENYESKHFPVLPPDPVEAIKFRMAQLGLTQSDLAKVLGQKSRVSEILSRKRKLTVAMIQQLHRELDIPAESLLPA